MSVILATFDETRRLILQTYMYTHRYKYIFGKQDLQNYDDLRNKFDLDILVFPLPNF